MPVLEPSTPSRSFGRAGTAVLVLALLLAVGAVATAGSFDTTSHRCSPASGAYVSGNHFVRVNVYGPVDPYAPVNPYGPVSPYGPVNPYSPDPYGQCCNPYGPYSNCCDPYAPAGSPYGCPPPTPYTTTTTRPMPAIPAIDTTPPVFVFGPPRARGKGRTLHVTVPIQCPPELCGVKATMTLSTKKPKKRFPMTAEGSAGPGNNVSTLKFKLPKSAIKALHAQKKQKIRVRLDLSFAARDAAGNVRVVTGNSSVTLKRP